MKINFKKQNVNAAVKLREQKSARCRSSSGFFLWRRKSLCTHVNSICIKLVSILNQSAGRWLTTRLHLWLTVRGRRRSSSVTFIRENTAANTLIRRDRLRREGTYFPDSDRRSIHYLAYYTVTCQHDKKLDTVCLFTIYLLPFSVFQQRNIFCQTDDVSFLPLRCFPLFSFSRPVISTQPLAKSWNHRIFQEY